MISNLKTSSDQMSCHEPQRPFAERPDVPRTVPSGDAARRQHGDSRALKHFVRCSIPAFSAATNTDPAAADADSCLCVRVAHHHFQPPTVGGAEGNRGGLPGLDAHRDPLWRYVAATTFSNPPLHFHESPSVYVGVLSEQVEDFRSSNRMAEVPFPWAMSHP
jgi:hypothetical protein